MNVWVMGGWAAVAGGMLVFWTQVFEITPRDKSAGGSTALLCLIGGAILLFTNQLDDGGSALIKLAVAIPIVCAVLAFFEHYRRSKARDAAKDRHLGPPK